MGNRRTSIFENGLIWFGAGVSLAEILTGTYFASLGFSTGLLAIIIGHIIGCGMMFFAGFIGGKTRKSAMETVKMSFGSTGALLFAVLNILQLVGWTAIMIYDGSLAAAGIFNIANWVWPVIIGGLIIIWILVGIENLGKINTVAMAALFILTLVLSFIIFGHGSLKPVANDGLTFGAAVELAVAMPLSWLPLISDYTREAKEPTKATWASVIVYGLYKRSKRAGKSNSSQRNYLWYCKLLDVCDRYGNLYLYRRIRYRTDHGKSRTWNCRIINYRILNCNNNILRCLVCRNFQ